MSGSNNGYRTFSCNSFFPLSVPVPLPIRFLCGTAALLLLQPPFAASAAPFCAAGLAPLLDHS